MSSLSDMSRGPRSPHSKGLLVWVRRALIVISFVATAQWARAQCSVSVSTTPPSPLLVGQDITLNATLTGSGVGQVELDGQVVCSSVPCTQDLGSNVAQGVHTLGWNCTQSGTGNVTGSQPLVVGEAWAQASPAYYIWSLLYAAPGNQSSNGFTNSVSTGTSSAVNQTFSQGESVSYTIDFSVKGGLPTGPPNDPPSLNPLGLNPLQLMFDVSAGGAVGASFMTANNTNFTEVITSATGSTVGSTQDPLNHYEDRFFLWLNPTIKVFQTGPTTGVYVVELPEDTAGDAIQPALVDVSVAELLNPAQIPLAKLESSTDPNTGATIPGLATLCAQQTACTLTNACGCAPSDFATIVAQDPLVFNPNNPDTEPSAQPNQLDPNRYVLSTAFSPEFLEGPDCAPPTCGTNKNGFTATDSTVLTTTVTDSQTYTVSNTGGFKVGVGPFTLGLSQTDTFSWSDAVTQGNSNGIITQGAVNLQTSTIQCGDGQTGAYNVYEDNRFHTFAFAPDPNFNLASCLTPQPDFNLVAFPPANLAPTILNGGSAQYLVSSVDYLGLTGTEQLSLTGANSGGTSIALQAGVSGQFSPVSSFNLTPSSVGSTVLTVNTTNNVTPAGTLLLNVVGTTGGITHTAPIAIVVEDFQMSVSPNPLTVMANGTATYTVTVTPLSGFNSTVVLGLGPLPAGVNGTFNPTSITGSGTSTLTITTSGATPGNATVTVTGTAGTDSQTATANLSVVDFAIAATPSSQTLAAGGSVTYTVSATGSNGFNNPIALSVGNTLPSGVSATFSSASITPGGAPSTLTVAASGAAQAQSVPITIDGSSQGSTHTAGVTVVVNPAPAISSLSPSQAPVGSLITVTGSNFNAAQGASTISINGTVATPTSWSNTSIVVPIPLSLGSGSVPVVVTVNGSSSNSATLSITPGITSLSTSSGPVGTVITITGTNFGTSQGSSSVSIGGAAATVTNWGSTSVSAAVPSSLGLGSVPVIVTVAGLASNSVNFSVTPGITSVAPASGPVGSSVTIGGTNFGTSQGGSSVTFGGTSATVTSWSTASIVVVVPSISIGSVSVVVTVNSTASNSSTYTIVPGVTSVSPSSGPVGTAVTITGSDFGTSQGSSTVTIGGVSVSPTSWTNTTIGFNVPGSLGVGAAPVVVTVGGEPGATLNFNVTPGITSLSPATGPVGTSVTITGTNFGSTQGTSTVTFGPLSATPSSWSPTSVVVPVPNGAAAGNNAVVVTVNTLASPGANFAVSPAITTLSTTSGPVGTSLTITGTSFGATQQGSTVTVGGVTVSPTNWSSTSVTVPVPASLGLGAAAVVVTVAGLPSNSVNFNVTPGITSLSPSSAPVGATVTITGTNFGTSQGSSTLSVGGAAVTPVSWAPASITFAVPASLGIGATPVVVTVGGSSSNSVNLTVTPGITSLSTVSGPVGTSVTINGTNFGQSQGSSSITFAGSAVSPTSWSNTAVAFAVPSVTPGADSVGVTVSGLSSNLATFTVTPVITNLSLISGPVGTATTITGTNFGSSQGSSFVTIGGISAAITSWSSGSIGVTVPAGLGPGSSPVIVTVNGAPSNTSFFTATPHITSLSPTAGATGTTVTISGSAFGSTQGSSTITFNGVAAANVTTWSNTSVVATVPSTASTGNVVVTVNSIPSNGVQFTVDAPVSYFAVSTASATPGLMTLQTATATSPTNILSPNLQSQPPGAYLIQAFNTQSGVPGISAVWPAGSSTTITVYMNQVSGTTGTLFPEVQLFLDSASGTPICGAVSSTALTTTQTLYTFSCAPATNITIGTGDQYYLWVGVSSTTTPSASEQAQLTIGPPSRGKQGANVTVPVP